MVALEGLSVISEGVIVAWHHTLHTSWVQRGCAGASPWAQDALFSSIDIAPPEWGQSEQPGLGRFRKDLPDECPVRLVSPSVKRDGSFAVRLGFFAAMDISSGGSLDAPLGGKLKESTQTAHRQRRISCPILPDLTLEASPDDSTAGALTKSPLFSQQSRWTLRPQSTHSCTHRSSPSPPTASLVQQTEHILFAFRSLDAALSILLTDVPCILPGAIQIARRSPSSSGSKPY